MTGVEVRRLNAQEARACIDGLAGVLLDCVHGGASVSYMAPFSYDQARAVFEDIVADVECQHRILLAAFLEGVLVGTVQIVPARAPNQPHRADVAKLLVHRSARRQGVAEQLMDRVDVEARTRGMSLLVLDTVTGGDAERLYVRLGWTKTGVIPNFALFPDGRPCDTTVLWKHLPPQG